MATDQESNTGTLFIRYWNEPAFTLCDWTRFDDGLSELERTQAANRETHRQWLATLAERISYNPLPLIMRAVNSLRLRWQSKAAPRWRRGRWKALT